MADRVHPNNEEEEEHHHKQQPSSDDVAISFPPSAKSTDTTSSEPLLPNSTFVVVVPKDQILRYPPPRQLSNHHCARGRRNSCRCCFWWLLGLIILLIVIAAVSVGVFFLVYRPKSPSYSVDKLSIQGFNLTTTATTTTTTPSMDVTIRANNPNNKIGIYYTRGSSIGVTHSDTQLCTGVLPVFYQPSNNVTLFQTVLRGSDMMLSSGDFDVLREQQRKRQIPLRLDLKVPVKIKVGSIKTWTITVKVRCYITVDDLITDASIISNNCDVDVKPWK